MIPLSLTVFSALSSDHLPVVIDTTCCSNFLTLLDRPNFKRSHSNIFQDCLEDKPPFNPELHNKEAVVTCIRNLSSAILSATAVATPKSRPRYDPRATMQAAIQDQIRLKNRLRKQWQESLQRSVTHRLHEWRNDEWGLTLENLDP